MVDYSQIVADLNLRYAGTYVRYRASMDSKWDTVFISEIVPQRNAVPHITLKGLGGNQVVSYGTEGEFWFDFPNTGCFNTGNCGYAFFRRPSRQNKRALCSATSTRMNFYSASRMVTHPILDIFVAHAQFNPTFPTKQEALEALNARKTYCLAVSPEFIVGLNTRGNKSHILFHRLTPIAEISAEGTLASLLHPAFESKVNEYLN
jgi:hypothetical protein